jgi:signal transduction histidine kinase
MIIPTPAPLALTGRSNRERAQCTALDRRDRFNADCALPYRGRQLALLYVYTTQPAGVCYRTEGVRASVKGEFMLDDDDAPIQVLEDERAAAILFVGSSTEPGPALLASEPGLPRVPGAEDGIVIVDAESGAVLETLPFPAHKTGPRLNGAAVHNTSGRATILDNVVRDITPYTRPLRQARLRVEELTTASRRKDEFLATLGHELRSPLAAIQNAVRLLSNQTGETPPRQRTQALIERQVRRMTQLVDDLLDVSRISHGRRHLQRERRGKRDCGESRRGAGK